MTWDQGRNTAERLCRTGRRIKSGDWEHLYIIGEMEGTKLD